MIAQYNAAMLGSLIVYLGLIGTVAGGVFVVKPLNVFHITTRLQGAGVLLAGLVVAVVGTLLPTGETRIAQVRTRLDEFAPAY